TFDFSAYVTSIEAVEFDVTIPNWAEGKNTIAYHWNNEANSQYIISGAAKEMVRLAAPAGAKSFTIQRSAGTSTRISQVCFQLSETEGMSIELPETKSAAQKVLRSGKVVILRGEKTYSISGECL
ncbi:MAG: hypothetical protein II551_06710, partial [Paludibacteraceae bacterium]|nr:hypothetical protein [Paludibacteraceae bacterium]